MGNLNPKPRLNSQNHNQDRVEDEEAFTCEICSEPANNKFKNNNKCIHPFCTDCMIKCIQGKIEDNVSAVKCPTMTCNSSLEPLSCRPKIAQMFDKWCDVLCESAVLKLDMVYCPNEDSSELILNECGEPILKRFVCPNCRKLFCFLCKVAWHARYRCEESGDMRDENDVAFGVLSKSKR